MTERVLVTGAGGFLGSHICHYMGRQGHIIAAVGRFSLLPEMLEFYPNLWKLCGMSLPDESFVQVVREFQPTLLIHCAGVASVPESVQNPHKHFQRTVDICAFTLDTVRQNAPECRFVLMSSAAVYGNPKSLPIDENTDCRPISPYGYHKLVSELLVQEYQALHGVNVIILRIFSAYGERLQRQVIFDLCRKFTDPETDTVNVYGTGEETRDFVHAVDVVRAITCVHEKGATGIFNVASGEQTRIGELVNLVNLCFGARKKVSFNGLNRLGDPLYWQADISKIKELGYMPKTSLIQGVREYTQWFASNYGV